MSHKSSIINISEQTTKLVLYPWTSKTHLSIVLCVRFLDEINYQQKLNRQPNLEKGLQIYHHEAHWF